ncbi:MAG: hypothetical protein ACOC9I_02070 [Actinomycetota bacterium]
MPEWMRFWEWMTSDGGESGEVSEADVQAQLNNLNLGNVSTGDICTFFENAYTNAGGHEGGFSYPPAGATPAQAATYYSQHVTVDASQSWHFEADDGAVINLGNIGGDVVTNPDVDVDLDFGRGELAERDEEKDELVEHEPEYPEYDEEKQPEYDEEKQPEYDDEKQPEYDEQQPEYQDEDQPSQDEGGLPDKGPGPDLDFDPKPYDGHLPDLDPAGLPHSGAPIDPIE